MDDRQEKSVEQIAQAGPTAFQVTVDQVAVSFPCRADESLLAAAHRLGHKGIPVGCRSGGCGVCKVAVLSGSYRVAAMSRDHISESEQAAGHVLACRIFPHSDLHVQVLGKLLNPFSKAAAVQAAAAS